MCHVLWYDGGMFEQHSLSNLPYLIQYILSNSLLHKINVCCEISRLINCQIVIIMCWHNLWCKGTTVVMYRGSSVYKWINFIILYSYQNMFGFNWILFVIRWLCNYYQSYIMLAIVSWWAIGYVKIMHPWRNGCFDKMCEQILNLILTLTVPIHQNLIHTHSSFLSSMDCIEIIKAELSMNSSCSNPYKYNVKGGSLIIEMWQLKNDFCKRTNIFDCKFWECEEL